MRGIIGTIASTHTNFWQATLASLLFMDAFFRNDLKQQRTGPVWIKSRYSSDCTCLETDRQLIKRLAGGTIFLDHQGHSEQLFSSRFFRSARRSETAAIS